MAVIRPGNWPQKAWRAALWEAEEDLGMCLKWEVLYISGAAVVAWIQGLEH